MTSAVILSDPGISVKAALPCLPFHAKLPAMERLKSIWISVSTCRNPPIVSIRVLSTMAFAAVLGAFIARGLHAATFGDFLGGMAVSFSGLLMMQIFRLRAVEYKHDPDESRLTELHLSR